ncbi:hypothetical protein SAMD00019534_113310 [Acytostelium subglobosum LB1]|uniref:hypothetical protein n=1 Tax=Acytostelium subglobosum LB1 TaxID=1410327 RepID=UPI000644C596|nr:hypothetical protein SAMD00019534_113310 [Acytostelium subglobosum LB1]GAM28155.1 hypothetical protein SAMD00019534_113310 [Acytostelium subglobosum LB1]|eukprot:XP_012748789.1 hypothetical protein SAMD00019534_113310 [Acytostelium subglobosum LB1]
MIGHRSIVTPVDTLIALVDSANEQFIRVFLQHSTIMLSDNVQVSPRKLIRPGVNVNILKLLHVEFNQAYECLWREALRSSTESRLVDSVVYLLSNVPPSLESILVAHVNKCYTHCASVGDIALLRCIHTQSKVAIDAEVYKTAADNGHVELINNCNSDIIQLPDLDLPQLIKTSIRKSINVRLKCAVKNDDLHTVCIMVESMTEPFEMDEEVWHLMSPAIAAYLSSQDVCPLLQLDQKSIKYIIMAARQPSSPMTEELAACFIRHCNIVTTTPCIVAMDLASEFSVTIMRAIHSHLSTPYSKNCVTTAIKNGNVEMMELLLEEQGFGKSIDQYPHGYCLTGHMKKQRLERTVLAIGSLKAVTMYMRYKKKNSYFCIVAVRNTLDVFEYVVGLHADLIEMEFYKGIVNEALTNDKPHYIDVLCNITNITPTQINLRTLELAARNNAIRSLEYILRSPFIPQQHYQRTIQSILNVSYEHGYSRIIRLCQQSTTIDNSDLFSSRDGRSIPPCVQKQTTLPHRIVLCHSYT